MRVEKQVAMVELAGATAHELNQPLTVLLGLTSHLQKIGADDAYSKELAMIVQAAQEVSRIVTRLGHVTRYETKPYVGNDRIIDLKRAAGESSPLIEETA